MRKACGFRSALRRDSLLARDESFDHELIESIEFVDYWAATGWMPSAGKGRVDRQPQDSVG
jgi:hypothetical protein